MTTSFRKRIKSFFPPVIFPSLYTSNDNIITYVGYGLTKLKRYGVSKSSLLHAYKANILSVATYAAPTPTPTQHGTT